MPQRWLRQRTRYPPGRWAAGCVACGVETSFTGEASNVQAWVWYHEHVCLESRPDLLPYLTLPRLDMTEEELLSWAQGNASTSALWLLKRLGEDPTDQVVQTNSQDQQ